MHGRLGVLVLVLLLSFVFSGYAFWSMGKAWFWKRTILRFKKSERLQQPTPGGIVFTGSSSVNFWKALAEDMALLNVVNRGFGGSHMAHVTHYATKIVVPYSPQRSRSLRGRERPVLALVKEAGNHTAGL